MTSSEQPSFLIDIEGQLFVDPKAAVQSGIARATLDIAAMTGDLYTISAGPLAGEDTDTVTDESLDSNVRYCGDGCGSFPCGHTNGRRTIGH